MWSLKGVGAMLVMAGILSVPLYFYWEFLTKGMSPPRGTLMLSEMEKKGVGDFSLPSLSGQNRSLSEFKQPLVLVNVWATWCAPCIKEVPSLINLASRFPKDLVILAVSFDREKSDIESFVKAFGPFPENFIILWDEKRKMEQHLGTDVLPETYILNSDRKLIRKIVGDTLWDEPMALDFFRTLIEK